MVAVPIIYNIGKLDTKVDALKETETKIDHKIEKLLDDGSSSKARLGVLENRVDRLENSRGAQEGKMRLKSN